MTEIRQTIPTSNTIKLSHQRGNTPRTETQKWDDLLTAVAATDDAVAAQQKRTP